MRAGLDRLIRHSNMIFHDQEKDGWCLCLISDEVCFDGIRSSSMQDDRMWFSNLSSQATRHSLPAFPPPLKKLKDFTSSLLGAAQGKRKPTTLSSDTLDVANLVRLDQSV